MPAESMLPDPVLRLVDAINSGDSATFLICFAEDGLVDAQGRTFRGLEAIAAWNEAENIGMGNQVEVIGAHTDQDEDVVLELQVTGEAYTGMARFAFELDGNHVRRMSVRI